MKKFLSLVLALAMVLTLAACGSSAPAATEAPKAEAPAAEAPAAEAPAAEAPAEDAFPDPSKTISFIIPYAAGDGLDTSTRALLENIDLPCKTLVENITGGSGTIGLQDAIGRDPDGYTVAILSNGPTIAQPLLNDTLTYKLESWHPMTFTTAPVLAAMASNTKLGLKDSEAMKAYLEDTAEYTVGVASMSGFGYVAAAAMFDQMGLMDKVTWVTYDGATALYQAYLSGETDLVVFDDNFAAQYVNAGEPVDIGVIINDIRSQYFPDVAAAGEWGVEGLGSNIGFKAAAVKEGTPQEVIDYLTEKINEAVVSEGYQEWCRQNYFGVLSTDDIYTGEEVMDMLVGLRETNVVVLTASGLLQ